MNIGFEFRNELAGIPGGFWIVQQFDRFLAGISGTWKVDHLDNGQHGDVRAVSVYAEEGFSERGRSAGVGGMTYPAIASSQFTASGAMTWTVGTADVTTLSYSLVGTTMTVYFILGNTEVAGVVDTELRILIPDGYTAQQQISGTFHYRDNLTYGTGRVRVTTAGNQLILEKQDITNWSASAGNTATAGQFSFEIQV
jgi:hypothetical protein